MRATGRDPIRAGRRNAQRLPFVERFSGRHVPEHDPFRRQRIGNEHHFAVDAGNATAIFGKVENLGFVLSLGVPARTPPHAG